MIFMSNSSIKILKYFEARFVRIGRNRCRENDPPPVFGSRSLDLRIRYQSRSPRQGSESDRSLDAGIVSARVEWVGTNF